MPSQETKDDFYVGYLPQAPTGLARFVRWVILALLALAVAMAALLVLLERPFDTGVFEFGNVLELEGIVLESPYPQLLVERPGSTGSAPLSQWLLVASGKHGAGEQFRGLDGRSVRLRGTLIYRQGLTMVEVVEGSVEEVGPDPGPVLETMELGVQKLVGEIVDSKCFLGVMKPGRGKPHRACAVRCLSGGVPPLFRVETEAGDWLDFLVVDAKGHPLGHDALDWVGEPLEIEGRVSRRGEKLWISAEAESFRRLGAGD